MKHYPLFFLFICLVNSVCYTPASAQTSVVKKINITVTDAITGLPVEGAEVFYKGLLKKQSKITDNAGKVNFEVVLVSSMLNATIEIKEYSHLPFKTTVTLRDNQEIYDVPLKLSSSSRLVSVSVTEGTTAIQNAKVTLIRVNGGGDATEQTDDKGNVSFDVVFMDPRTVEVVIEKAGYKTNKTSFQMTKTADKYALTVDLKKDETVKWLRVKVTAMDDGSPVIGARVSAQGKTVNDTYWNETDQNGEANVAILSGGEMEISARHNDFWTETQPHTINYYGDAKEFPLSFTLKRKGENPKDRKLLVTVYSKGQNDALVPVYGALVEMGKQTGITDQEGKASIDVKLQLAEQIPVKVSAENLERMTKNYIVGGDDWRNPPKNDQLNFILDKPKEKIFKLKVVLLDEKTDKPILDGQVVVKSSSGKTYEAIYTIPNNTEYNFNIPKQEVVNGLRVEASPIDYEEEWSDIIPESLQGDSWLHTVYLKKKTTAAPVEKKYGPFIFTNGDWTATGLILKKGATLRAETTGRMELKNPSPGPGDLMEITFNENVLRAKVGNNIFRLNTNESTINEGGTLELGCPKLQDYKGWNAKGSFTVFVYAKDAGQTQPVKTTIPVTVNNNQTNNNTQLSSNEKKDKAKKELEFLKKVLKGEKIADWTDPREIAAHVKSIVTTYDLRSVGQEFIEECITAIKTYYDHLYNRTGNPPEEEKKRYAWCVEDWARALQGDIDYKQSW